MEPLRKELSHAFIISGPSEEGRRALTARLAQTFVCSGDGERPCLNCSDCRKAGAGVHPDIITVSRAADKREITVDVIRTLRADAVTVPNEAVKKVYIIKEADLLNIPAQNAFLKTLEEPPTHAVFLLETENPAALLPTVRSRCAVKLAPSAPEAAEITERARVFFTTLSKCGGTEMMRLLFSYERLERSDFAALVSELRTLASAGIRGEAETGLSRTRLMGLLHLLETADGYIEANVGTGHILGLFMSGLIPLRNEEKH